jgi:hypothetical protein
MKRVLFILIPALLVILVIAAVIGTRYYLNLRREPAADQIRIESPDEFYRGVLYITVDGAERKIADRAFRVSLHNEGREVIYVGAEDETDKILSVRIYNVKTEQTLKAIFTDVPHLSALAQDVKLSDGKRLLLISTTADIDAPSHLWIVDPERGAIYFQRSAIRVKNEGDEITIAYYRDEDWAKMKDDPELDFTDLDYILNQAQVKPSKIEKLDLRKIRNNAAIDAKQHIALAK